MNARNIWFDSICNYTIMTFLAKPFFTNIDIYLFTKVAIVSFDLTMKGFIKGIVYLGYVFIMHI